MRRYSLKLFIDYDVGEVKEINICFIFSFLPHIFKNEANTI